MQTIPIHRDLGELGEMKKLREENESLSQTRSQLMSQLTESGDELKRVSEEVEGLGEENKKLRENYEAAKAEVESVKREKDEVVIENRKVKLEKEAVTDAATIKFRGFVRRVSALESNVALLKLSIDESGHVGDELRVGISQGQETLETLGSDGNVEGLVGTRSVCGAPPLEEKSASSLSCRQGVSTVKIKEQQKSFGSDTKHEGLVKCQARSKTMTSVVEKKAQAARKTMSSVVEKEAQAGSKTMTSVVEKKATSTPLTTNYSSASVPICISDSDDDCEAKGLKRKLDFTDASDHSKTPIIAPKPCNLKVTDTHTDMKVESGYTAKHWEYEADMVDDLEKYTELCMQAICALYRRHISVGKSKGFMNIDAFRGVVLGKFLVDGDKDGGLKKSLADLVDYDSDGASRCRRIAISHSSRLFEIYKSKEDPNFAPPN